MIIDLGNGQKYDADKQEMIMADGTRFHAPMVTDDTPEGKAMLEGADEYMKILEGK